MAGATLQVNINANTQGFQQGINSVSSQSHQLSEKLKGVGTAIAGAFAASAIINFAKEASQMASVAEGVEQAFKRIGGEQYLEGLQKATKGTVTNLELMKAAVQANNFGIPLKQLGSLLAFAHQRAKDTGQSVDYLVNSIVMGIGRKSPLILDNLGISAVALKAKMKGIGTETATVGDVAAAVGEIASEAMSKVGDSAETTAEKFARSRATMDEWKVTIGRFVNDLTNGFAVLISHMDKFIDRLSSVNASQYVSGWDKLKNSVKGLINLVPVVALGKFAYSKISGKDIENDLKKLEEELEGIQNTAKNASDDWFRRLANNLKGFKGTADEAMQFLKDKRSGLVAQLGQFEGVDPAKMSKAMKVVYETIRLEYVKISDLINNPMGIDEMLFGDDPEKTIRTLQVIQDEIDELQKTRLKETEAHNIKELFAIDQRIDKLEKEKKAIEKLVLAERNKELNIPVKLSLRESIPDLALNFAYNVGKILSGQSTGLNKISNIGLQPLARPMKDKAKWNKDTKTYDILQVPETKTGAEQLEEFANTAKKTAEVVQGAFVDMSSGISTFIEDFATGIGELLSGGATFEDFGKMILSAVGGFMSTLGKQLIALGVAKVVADTALKIPGGGFALIAAGAALVALGGAVSATMSSSPMSGGGSSVSSGAYSGTGNQNNKLEIVGVVKGTDIYWSQKRTEKVLNNTTARSGR